jgi:hypothetical protein
LAVIAFEQGDLQAADALNRQSLPVLMKLGDRFAMADVVQGLADVCALVDTKRAARIWGAVERLRESIGSPRDPAEQAKHESRVAAARAALGDDAAFDLAWCEGRAMNLQQAVDFALAAEAGKAPAS